MNTTYIIDGSYLSPDLSVVSDGYSGKSSTKVHENFLRWFSSEVLFDESSFEAMPSDMFLATPNSNVQLVYLLLIHVNNSGGPSCKQMLIPYLFQRQCQNVILEKQLYC